MSELKIIERLVDDLVTRVEALEEKSEEIWVPIDENPSYFISNKGRVKRYDDFYPKIGVDSNGYFRVWFNSRFFRVHRLLAQAFIPNPYNKPEVDHIDGNGQNNSLSNLRWCNRAENCRNRKVYKNSTTDRKGVTFRKDTGKYRARIQLDQVRKELGSFDTLEEATAAYEAAAKELFGDFHRAQ